MKIQADNLHLQALLQGGDAASLDALARQASARADDAAAGEKAGHRDPGEDVLAFDAWGDASTRVLSAGLPAAPATLDAAGVDRLAEHILAPLS